ncbi:hypothetical protein BaRGS_00018528 [Batillaria attramentaria]|uniref:Uncharacterized protein n=1 Tax=Batillaria attramentaria TaxID=370345 RepID=A0ABD0KT49_9CAEN
MVIDWTPRSVLDTLLPGQEPRSPTQEARPGLFPLRDSPARAHRGLATWCCVAIRSTVAVDSGTGHAGETSRSSLRVTHWATKPHVQFVIDFTL